MHGVKALEKHRFRPMYAQANMGHPSREVGFLKPHPSYRSKAIEQQFQIGKLWRDSRSALGKEIMRGHAPASLYDKTDGKIRKV
jgi:hypothetical protein